MSTTNTVNLISLACSAVTSSILASKPIRRIALKSSLGSSNCSDICLNEGQEQSIPHNADIEPIPTSSTKDIVGARVKLDGTIVTDADGASQRIIVENIRKISKEIRIVGEESKEDEANGDHCEEEDVFDETILHEVSQDIHSRIQNKSLEKIESDADAERVSVFIDPLDGTSNYANGRYDSVTILIAIVLDNIPLFGVVCKPFGQPGDNFIDSGCFVIYGGTLLNGAFIAGGGQCRPNPNENGEPIYKAVISKSRSAGIVQQCLQKLHSQGLCHKDPLYISGAGEKTLRLILGTNHESLWFFPKPGTSLWDVAAADALLAAVGGKLTDKYGHPIDYSKNRLDADNTTGIVACNNLHLHEQCIQTFNEGGFIDDA